MEFLFKFSPVLKMETARKLEDFFTSKEAVRVKINNFGKIKKISMQVEDCPALDGSITTRSISQEILEPIEGNLSGKVPDWLNGSLIMNGPGTLVVGETKLNHLFDGMALLQKFTILSSGKITYENKFLKSEAYKKGIENNKLMFGEFGSAGVQPSLFKK